jgi:redox-sensitive bicupin YhaK (pirin superfamily)
MTTHTQAPIVVRRDKEIFEAEGGWFHARWHFSFDYYIDPKNTSLGWLRVFNHDTLRPGAVWPMHPHRDVEGITYVVAGEFEHEDNIGGGGVLYPGAVQRLTLGSGALHSEKNHSPTQEMQFIQMWILPNERNLEPSLEQKQYSESDRHNRLLQILRPVGAPGDGVTVHQDVRMFVSRLDPGQRVEHAFQEGRGGYFYLIDGEAEVTGERLSKGDAAKILGTGGFEVKASAAAELLLVDTPLV